MKPSDPSLIQPNYYPPVRNHLHEISTQLSGFGENKTKKQHKADPSGSYQVIKPG